MSTTAHRPRRSRLTLAAVVLSTVSLSCLTSSLVTPRVTPTSSSRSLVLSETPLCSTRVSSEAAT
ncbi:hypothetical protein E4T44_03457 [Aureobasidium sp. EXF-8845]|nr:hypothetical protein E4T45_08356 [Aureobasidium sp. EXF-8846]KAI4849256.1 hypothetical protein E4T44_03457 [Aureobasidium sp. EXF-8845]